MTVPRPENVVPAGPVPARSRSFRRRSASATPPPGAVPATAATTLELGVSDMAKYLLTASLFISITRFHMAVPLLGKLQFPLLLSAGACFAMLAELQRWRPADLTKHWIPRSMSVLLIVAVIGAPMSIYVGRSVRFLFDTLLTTLTLAILAWGVGRGSRGIRYIARLFASSAVATSVMAIVFNRRDDDGRLAGAFTYDPNDLALVAAVAIPLLMWWAMDKRAKSRWIALLAIPLLARVVLMTGSRGGFLGLAAMAFGLVIVGIVGGAGKLRSVGLCIGLGAILSFPLLPARIQDRVKSIGASDDYNMTSSSGRKQVWTRGIGYMMDNPILGVGIDNFRTAEGRLSAIGRERAAIGRGMKWSAAHNSFVQVGAELGLISGVVFAVTMLAIPVALIRRYRRVQRMVGARGNVDLLPAMLGISVFVFDVTGFFLSQAYGDIVYMLIAMSTALLMQPLAVPPAQAMMPPRGSARMPLPNRRRRPR